MGHGGVERFRWLPATVAGAGSDDSDYGFADGAGDGDDFTNRPVFGSRAGVFLVILPLIFEPLVDFAVCDPVLVVLPLILLPAILLVLAAGEGDADGLGDWAKTAAPDKEQSTASDAAMDCIERVIIASPRKVEVATKDSPLYPQLRNAVSFSSRKR